MDRAQLIVVSKCNVLTSRGMYALAVMVMDEALVCVNLKTAKESSFPEGYVSKELQIGWDPHR